MMAQQMVSFVIAGEEFGIDILKVREIIRLTPITRVPGTPEYVEGVINLRGQIVPVVDLRRRFRLPDSEATRQSRIVVVELEDKVVGFIVDRVREVLHVDANLIGPAPELSASPFAACIMGIARLEDRLLILLDMEAVASGIGYHEIVEHAPSEEEEAKEEIPME